MNTIFGKWNVRILYTVGLLKIVATELAKFNLDVMAVQDEGWKSASRWFYNILWSGKANNQLGTGFFMHKLIREFVKILELLSD